MLFEIYIDNVDSRFELEAESKGYRPDFYVKVGDELFHVFVYDNVRLQQDFQTEMEYYGFYAIDPNLVLVKNVTREEIKSTLLKLWDQKYFEDLKPLDENQISKLQLKKI